MSKVDVAWERNALARLARAYNTDVALVKRPSGWFIEIAGGSAEKWAGKTRAAAQDALALHLWLIDYGPLYANSARNR